MEPVQHNVTRGLDDRVFSYDGSSQDGGRPFIFMESLGHAAGSGRIFSCHVGSASGNTEVIDDESSMLLEARCEEMFHVPCGVECVDDFSMVCNGEEECDAGTDEQDCDERCDGIHTEEGEIVSPGFPHEYPPNSRCANLILAPEGHTIRLHFEGLSLEAASDCFWDAVEVYDGPNPDYPLIGAFCGDDTPDDIISSGEALLVVFRSDGSENYPGFLASFHFMDGNGGGGNVTGLWEAFYGGFTGFVDLRAPEDAENWRITIEFPIKLKSFGVRECYAEVVGKRRKQTFFIENRHGHGGVGEGDRIHLDFMAITSRKKKGAVGRVSFMSLD